MQLSTDEHSSNEKDAGKHSAKDSDMLAAETRHLQDTLEQISAAIEEARSLVSSAERNYQDAKIYMVDNRGELDPSEQFQNELFLQRVDQQSVQAYYARDRLEKLLDSPYFAKIMFVTDADEEEIIAYIGRFSFNYQNKSVISDWRSPVAGLFYDFDIGKAEYETPSGFIRGQLRGKRQFKIESGKMVYAVDSASSVRDEILQQELSKTSDEKMKSIISSIQREQNSVIRDERGGTLIIQGVAGSGKTSIALHRLAFLLYRQKDHLSSKSVAILSPNKVFGDYISNVLPELGEEPIIEACFKDIFEKLLEGIVKVETARSYIDDTDSEWHKRARYKGSFDFMKQVLDYIEKAPEKIFKGRSLTFGKSVIDAEWLESRFMSYANVPVYERIESLISDCILELSSKVFSLGYEGMPTRGRIRAELRKMLIAKDGLSLYKKYFRDQGKKKYFVMPNKQSIEWEDACPLVLFQSVFERQEEYAAIEHLAIDEMQDLTPVQHTMIAKLFTCDKTILGDYHQMVDPENQMQLGSMREIYRDARTVELKKSYRSTLEIAELAKKVKNIPDLETVERHGEKPRIIMCANSVGMINEIEKAIACFGASDYKTFGILHRSEELARRYYWHDPLNLIQPQC
ncbi:MAG: HelD family protein [Raoultibacter sp.]|jgi:DNA helicase-2/ATP-dependent DNA helicase PcrA